MCRGSASAHCVHTVCMVLALVCLDLCFVHGRVSCVLYVLHRAITGDLV